MIYSPWHFCCNLERSTIGNFTGGNVKDFLFLSMAGVLVGFCFYPMDIPAPSFSLPGFCYIVVEKAESHGCFSTFVRVSEIILPVNMVPLQSPNSPTHARIRCLSRGLHSRQITQAVIKISQVRRTIHFSLLGVIPIRGFMALWKSHYLSIIITSKTHGWEEK